jgi:hypothetical protein
LFQDIDWFADSTVKKQNVHAEIELAGAADGQKNLFPPATLGASHHACGLYNFTPTINLLPSGRWHGRTKIAADGNGNDELMDITTTNNPGGFATVRQ